MQITATNQEFLNLFKALQDSKECKGLDFAKAVISNSEIIKNHLQYIEDMAVPTEEFIKLSIAAKKFIELNGNNIVRDKDDVYYFNDNYKGGEIQFDKFNLKYKPNKNELLFFPSSYIYSHQVLPITEGCRYAVVWWLY